MSNLVLPLNASFEPLRPMHVRRAIRLVLQGKAEIVEGDPEQPVRSGREVMPRPIVIRLIKYVNVPPRLTKSVTNTMLFARDRYTCQYCNRSLKQLERLAGPGGRGEHLTRDHVLPLSRGGANSWENCATACSSCNSRKANKTPAEAGMTLRSTPMTPKRVELHWLLRKMTKLQRRWILAFYGQDIVDKYDDLD